MRFCFSPNWLWKVCVEHRGVQSAATLWSKIARWQIVWAIEWGRKETEVTLNLWLGCWCQTWWFEHFTAGLYTGIFTQQTMCWVYREGSLKAKTPWSLVDDRGQRRQGRLVGLVDNSNAVYLEAAHAPATLLGIWRNVSWVSATAQWLWHAANAAKSQIWLVHRNVIYRQFAKNHPSSPSPFHLYQRDVCNKSKGFRKHSICCARLEDLWPRNLLQLHRSRRMRDARGSASVGLSFL